MNLADGPMIRYKSQLNPAQIDPRRLISTEKAKRVRLMFIGKIENILIRRSAISAYCNAAIVLLIPHELPKALTVLQPPR
jgi:hypothetical protein